MIIQCPSCRTKFSLDESALAGVDNPRFHCSRCDHYFELGSGTKLAEDDVPPPEMPKPSEVAGSGASATPDGARREPMDIDNVTISHPEQLPLLQESVRSTGLTSSIAAGLLSGSSQFRSVASDRYGDSGAVDTRDTSARGADPIGESRSSSTRAFRRGIPESIDIDEERIATAEWPENPGSAWIEADLSELHATLASGVEPASSPRAVSEEVPGGEARRFGTAMSIFDQTTSRPSERGGRKDPGPGTERGTESRRSMQSGAHPGVSNPGHSSVEDDFEPVDYAAAELERDALASARSTLGDDDFQPEENLGTGYAGPGLAKAEQFVADEGFLIHHQELLTDSTGTGSGVFGLGRGASHEAPAKRYRDRFGSDRTTDIEGGTPSASGDLTAGGRRIIARFSEGAVVPGEEDGGFRSTPISPSAALLPGSSTASMVPATTPQRRTSGGVSQRYIQRPGARSGSWRAVAGVASFPVLLGLACWWWSAHLDDTPPVLRDALYLRPDGVPRLPPQGLEVVELRSDFITLDNGQQVLEIQGQLLNATNRSYGRVRLEARVFDAVNSELGRLVVDAQSSLAGARLETLSVPSIKEMQGHRSSSFVRLGPSDRVPFRIIFADHETSLSPDQIRWFSARVFSVEPVSS